MPAAPPPVTVTEGIPATQVVVTETDAEWMLDSWKPLTVPGDADAIEAIIPPSPSFRAVPQLLLALVTGML
ncbi:hypothetical protein FGL98_04265 [Leekyejoonella antrihumi]|uniref:Uncharacterized protein n=1 Tax=Leekyejoonella antrihumi TaxID=1660198 RepID=A0A563E6U1_9MICO|nr:hypothetical protein FGL98_04265 [Leekyejoonella antrihumi]